MQGSADVAVKPALLFAGTLVLGCLLSWVVPLGPGLGSANGRAFAVGGSLVLIGLALATVSVREVRRMSANVVPGEGATALVKGGPYRFTRNPIYIGFVILYFGLAIVLTSVWMLLLLIPGLIILQRGVVEREETHLQAKLGEPYRRYQARVPRWL
jgi:protein-S-isoprenylcysteine O-methyltransferase Ste14